MKHDPNEKSLCLNLSDSAESDVAISTENFVLSNLCLNFQSTDFFSAYLSARAIYVCLCRDFDFHIEQLSAENRPTFRRIQTGLLCRARSNIFIRGGSLSSFLHQKLSFLLMQEQGGSPVIFWDPENKLTSEVLTDDNLA